MQIAQKSFSRRDFLKLSGAGVAGAALLGTAGCGSGGGDQGGSSSGGGSGGSGITVVLDTEPSILNPFITGGDAGVTADATAGILESPLVVQPDLSYGTQLAEELPEVTSEDPLTVEYRLREGITFSDGEPLTSDDALFTYEQIMNEDNNIVSRLGWEDIESFETPDERTVRIVFSRPYASWRSLLTSEILPRHIYEDANFNEDLNNEIVGSGPFVFDSWNKGENLTVTRNEDYWGEAAGLERVTYRFITDSNSIIAALQAGEVEFINPGVDTGIFDRLEGIPDATVESASGTQWAHIAFNVENISDVRFRRAIAYGIDRSQITSEILQSVNIDPLQSVLVPDQEPYFTPAWEQYGNDPERARQLVGELEADGVTPEITYKASAGTQLLEVVLQIVQQQLESVGITVNLEFPDPQTFLTQDLTGGNYEMGTFSWRSVPEPSIITALFSGNSLPPDGQNYYLYSNEEVTTLLEEADVTVDVEARAELVQQAQELISDDVPVIPLYQSPEIYAYSNNLTGPVVNPTIAGAYWNLREWSLG